MIVRQLSDIEGVEWGNGLSRRFLLDADDMGYTLTDTIVYAGTRSGLRYEEHLEACYCISGRGKVVVPSSAPGGAEISFDIVPGTMYALDSHEAHYLIADAGADLRLICVFSPALKGDERHILAAGAFSRY